MPFARFATFVVARIATVQTCFAGRRPAAAQEAPRVAHGSPQRIARHRITRIGSMRTSGCRTGSSSAMRVYWG